MLIVGAKGFAKELLQHFHNNNETENLYFFYDLSDQKNKNFQFHYYFYNIFTIIISLMVETNAYCVTIENHCLCAFCFYHHNAPL